MSKMGFTIPFTPAPGIEPGCPKGPDSQGQCITIVPRGHNYKKKFLLLKLSYLIITGQDLS